MPGVSTSAGLSNHVMASSPSHPYFKLLIDSLLSYDRNYGTPYLTIMGSAGPHMVSFVWKSYLNADPLREQPRVRILMPGEDGLMEDFFATVKGETWHTWDVKLFRWASHHLPLVVLVGLSSLLLAATIVWAIFWSSVLLVGIALRRASATNLPLWSGRA
jgi:inositol phosphorylceramide mannosyltransferase catalytic subunit